MEIGLLAASMRRRTFHAGDVVTAEGEGADGFFVIQRGEAEVAVEGQSRGRVGPGDFFGEIALLMGTERTATITATTELECYCLTPSDFQAVVEGNPAIALKLLQSMAERS
jgi:CRP/FNR family transcriptional regulator, cyclic AMP receptor protein